MCERTHALTTRARKESLRPLHFLQRGSVCDRRTPKHWAAGIYTKRNRPISHPGGHPQALKRRKPDNDRPGEQIPYNGSLPAIVADHEPSSASLADIVYRYKADLILVVFEASLERQRVMVQTGDHRTLGVEEMRRRSGTRHQVFWSLRRRRHWPESRGLRLQGRVSVPRQIGYCFGFIPPVHLPWGLVQLAGQRQTHS